MYPLRKLCTCLRGNPGNRRTRICIPWNRSHGYAGVQQEDSIHTNTDKVFKALADPDIRVVAQIAPAVRVAVGDHYGLQKGRSVMGKIVNALHRMGFDEVYDTTFSADLTIMEETKEFLNRVEKG